VEEERVSTCIDRDRSINDKRWAQKTYDMHKSDVPVVSISATAESSCVSSSPLLPTEPTACSVAGVLSSKPFVLSLAASKRIVSVTAELCRIDAFRKWPCWLSPPMKSNPAAPMAMKKMQNIFDVFVEQRWLRPVVASTVDRRREEDLVSTDMSGVFVHGCHCFALCLCLCLIQWLCSPRSCHACSSSPR